MTLKKQNTLVVFARPPKVGKVKTRLAHGLGTAKTLEIYNYFLQHTQQVAKKTSATVQFYWSELNELKGQVQKGTDLGERMYNALSNEIRTGPVCLIGSDVPQLTSSIITDAFAKLGQFDVVLGPSTDGGYYLIGLKSEVPAALFLNKTWSHNKVLSEALAQCKQLRLSTYLLPELSDIDTLEDYLAWQAQTKAQT